ncbi:heavy-metal-associated domain-containing protein [Fodinibius sp. SL11]|uniref:heavy-metal-associated domain-containing protein n=1 Tax=Fodinibius sp. SL11 TaxID=3425690 RepID=UPI003F884C64
MESLTKTILRSDELSCPSCVSNIESTLNNMKGVQEAKVHFNTGRIEVEHDSETVSEQNLIDAIQDTGYEAKVSQF